MSLLVINDRAYLEHAPGNWPEGPHRLEAVWMALAETGVKEALVFEPPEPAREEDLALVHTERHIDRIRRFARAGGGYLTLDTVVSAESFDVALLAVGGALKALEAVLSGRTVRSAALVRPPGHHATPEEGMGFCLFNNVAVAAAHARKRRGLERVMIIDWDLHHGNGTEAAFYASPGVLFVSCHESPAYPGTGWLTDTGEGEGEGYTVNLPLPPGSGDRTYREAFETVIAPVARAYRPEVILVSCGLDAHYLDPIGRLRLSTGGYGELSAIVCGLADELCQGRVVFVLEGGYDVVGLGWGMASILNVASGRGGPIPEPEGYDPPEPQDEPLSASSRLDDIRSVQQEYWPV
ncbi:MAG: histone deacetylase [Bacillota bacterium]